MMINLEGKQVFMEAVEAAKTDYKELTSSATKILYNELADRKKKKVEGIQELFFAELSNPQLCGQGPKARSLAAELADELPGFRTLAGGGDCKQVSALINSYTQSIHKLLANHPALTGHQESEELLRRIKESETIAQTKLDEIKKEIAAGDDLLGNIRPEIEDIAGTYQTLSTELAAKPSQLSFKANIDLNEVRGLGAWGQLPGLILSRVDRLSTYLYLLLAVFFDWMLVYFFAQLSEAKRAISNKPQGPRTDIKAHWQ
jgi:hypothetical protein